MPLSQIAKSPEYVSFQDSSDPIDTTPKANDRGLTRGISEETHAGLIEGDEIAETALGCAPVSRDIQSELAFSNPIQTEPTTIQPPTPPVAIVPRTKSRKGLISQSGSKANRKGPRLSAPTPDLSVTVQQPSALSSSATNQSQLTQSATARPADTTAPTTANTKSTLWNINDSLRSGDETPSDTSNTANISHTDTAHVPTTIALHRGEPSVPPSCLTRAYSAAEIRAAADMLDIDYIMRNLREWCRKTGAKSVKELEEKIKQIANKDKQVSCRVFIFCLWECGSCAMQANTPESH